MWNPEGESDRSPLRPCFDRRLKLEFHGSRVTSDAGVLAYRELDDALGLTALAGDILADSRTGKNGWHGVVGLLRQSVYGRLAGYEDVNDAERLGRDPAMRWIVGGKAVERGGASTSQMGRFETELLANDENLAALADLSGVWIDRVHARKLPRMIVLDMDSSVSPTLECLQPLGTLVLFGQSSGPVPPFDVGTLARGSHFVTRPGLGHYIGSRSDYEATCRDLFKAIQAGG